PTCAARFTSMSVSTPLPGPISTTSLSDTSPSAATIFSAAFPSARKFCPNFGLAERALPRFPPAVTLTLDGMGSRLHLPLAGLFGPFLEALPNEDHLRGIRVCPILEDRRTRRRCWRAAAGARRTRPRSHRLPAEVQADQACL